MKDNIYQYLLMLGDNSMILGHRLSELCGHGPELETDIALTNLSLDLFGQVRHYFQYATKLKGEGSTEDSVAFLRYPHEYRNTLLVEQPNTDFAYVIARQFLFDAYHLPLLEQLVHSHDKHISAIANKSTREVKYHLRFSSEWVKRLGDGTEESHRRMQAAIDYLWPYAGELFKETELEAEMKENEIGADLAVVKQSWSETIAITLHDATIQMPENAFIQSGGKKGIHSEHLGFILADLQFMQRAYPNMTW